MACTIVAEGCVLQRNHGDTHSQMHVQVKAQKIKVSPKKSRGSSSSPKNATKDRNLQRKLATLFKQYDADNSNSIDASELHKLLCDYGRHTSSAEPSIEECVSYRTCIIFISSADLTVNYDPCVSQHIALSVALCTFWGAAT